ncbi:MAG: ABC transporter ATP-binding protein [Frankia sp.]
MTVELELRDARAGYGTVEVLHGLDVAVPHGAVTALIGANGAGKSTTLRVLAGLLPLRQGSLTWDGTPIEKLSSFDRARRGMLLIPDERAVFASLTVRENLLLVTEGLGRGDDIDEALTTFPRLGERLPQKAGTLSGGERRMLALGRALLARPKVLLIDELSLGLAPRVAAELFAWVGTLPEQGTTVVLADQYAEAASRLASVVYVLHRGQRSFVGDPAELGHDGIRAAGSDSAP